MQGNIDIVSDLSTLFCGFNPKRVFNGYVFLGGGLNRGFDNDEANALDTRTYEMEYLWRDGKFLIAGRMGLGCNLRLNDRLSINIEGNANVLSDKFNSKKAGNADWQFNALIGLNIKFGKGYTETKPATAEERSCSTANETGYLLCFELSEDTRRSKVKNRYVGRISAKQSGCKG